MPLTSDPNLLVGTSTRDDSAVYKVSDELALVQSVDFFPPIVDDPYSFGAIAAANSLSDIYAMGARPLIGLNLVCFPMSLSKDVLAEILKGGMDKMTEAGATIVGGHTIDDAEPKYGLAVTGVIRPGDQVTNSGALPGDQLVLTKPLGSGIVVAGRKAGKADKSIEDQAVEIMSTLNKTAAEAMVRVGANSCTDITGFGLLGHLREMVESSGVGARINLPSVPTIPGTWELAEMGVAPGGTLRNIESLQDAVVWGDGISEEAKLLLSDAQTSGGLLMSVAPEKTPQFLNALKEAGVNDSVVVGEIVVDDRRRIHVTE